MTRTALVTGGAGFIGSHLVDSLLADGIRAVVVDDLSSGDARRLAPEADFRELSTVDRAAFDAVCDETRPDTIFHLGAQSSVTVAVKEPERDLSVNVLGTLHVLEAARRLDAPIVFSSTGGALYGNEAPLPTPEDRLPAPLSPYGASKWAGEAYINTWANAHGQPHVICRLANVYGPRQTPHGEAGVVSIFSHHINEGRAPKLFGEGRPSRDYIHVLDVVAALRKAAGVRGTFNVATGVETTVREIWDGLVAVSGTDVEPELAPLRPGEMERSCMNPARAERELGFRAAIPFAQGLPETYAALVAEFERGTPR
jgi:UDP-glucose 4-epimerase